MTRDMTSGSPIKLIFAFGVPLFIGMMFQQFYHFADTIIVGRILGEGALAAVGSIGPVNFLILGFCLGLSNGLVVPIAQSFGAEDYNKLKLYVGNIFWICLFFGTVLTVTATVLCRLILEWTGTPADIIDMAFDYLFIIFLGIPAVLAFNTLAGILRSLGDSRTPLIVMIISAIISIVLAIVFILVFHMGVIGAALATVVAQTLSAIGFLIIIKRNFYIIHISKSHLRPNFDCIKKLLGIGIPLGSMFFVMGIGSVFLQIAINSLGSLAVAAVTAATRVEALLSSASNSLGAALTTFCGQNIGAGKIDRIKQGVKICVLIGLIYSLAAFLLTAFFGRYIALLFIDAGSIELLDHTFQFMFITMAFFWSLALVHIVRAAVQGMGYGKIVFVGGILEMVGRGAAGLVFVPLFGFIAVCFAAPAAWVLANIFTIPVFMIILNRASRR